MGEMNPADNGPPLHRTQKMNINATFCMESGQVKTGEGPADTFVKMLQEVVRVTLPMAQGIAEKYPDVTSLMKAFRRDGPLILENVSVSPRSLISRPLFTLQLPPTSLPTLLCSLRSESC